MRYIALALIAALLTIAALTLRLAPVEANAAEGPASAALVVDAVTGSAGPASAPAAVAASAGPVTAAAAEVTTSLLIVETGAPLTPESMASFTLPTPTTKPMMLALIIAGVLSLLTTALIARLKKMSVAPSRQKVRQMALGVSAFVGLVAGIVGALAMGMPIEAAIVMASGPMGSTVVNALLSLVQGTNSGSGTTGGAGSAAPAPGV